MEEKKDGLKMKEGMKVEMVPSKPKKEDKDGKKE